MPDYVNKLGLENINVLYDLEYDKQNYVEIKNLPDVLSFGKHFFTVSIRDMDNIFLKESSTLSIQFQDSSGNDIYFDFTDKYDIDGDAVGYVWLKQDLYRTNDSITNGTGYLTIVGEMDGNIPSDWLGKPNIRITKPISINTDTPNFSTLIFQSSSLMQSASIFSEVKSTDTGNTGFTGYTRSYLQVSSSFMEAISGQLNYIEVSYRETRTRTPEFKIFTKYPVIGTTATSSFEVTESLNAGLGPTDNVQMIPLPRDIRRNQDVEFRLRFIDNKGEYAQDISLENEDVIITGSISTLQGTQMLLETDDNIVHTSGSLVFGDTLADGIRIDFQPKGSGKYPQERTLEFTPVKGQHPVTGKIAEGASFAIAEQGGFINDINSNAITQSVNSSMIGSVSSSITSSINSIILGSSGSSIQYTPISTIIGGMNNKIHHSSSITESCQVGIVGGSFNIISSSIAYDEAVRNSFIFGGNQNSIHQTGSGTEIINASIVGGYGNKIRDGFNNSIMGGNSNAINSSAGTILGSTSCTVNHEYSSIIGMKVKTTTAKETVYVQNLDVAGSMTVNQITASIVSSSILHSSGSNIFGDAASDTHTFNGAITSSEGILIKKTGAYSDEKLFRVLEDGSEKFSIDEDGDVTVAGDIGVADNVTIDDYLYVGKTMGGYTGNTTSYINFQTADKMRLYANSENMLTLDGTSATGDKVVVGDGGNVNFQVKTLNDNYAIYAKGDNNKVGIGTSVPSKKLTVAGDISASGDLFVNNITASAANFSSHITASGNISSSGDILASGDVYANDIIADSVRIGDVTTNSLKFIETTYGVLLYARGAPLYPHMAITAPGSANQDDIRVAIGRGAAAAADKELTVAGSISASGAMYLEGNLNMDADSGQDIKFSDTSHIDFGRFGGASRLYASSADMYLSADENLYFRPDNDVIIEVGTTDWARFFGGEKTLLINSAETSAPSSNLTVFGDVWASGSDGHITASGNISSSGHLIASTSNAAGNSYLTVLVDTGSGQFYYTGSYGGGSSGGGGGTTTNALTAGAGLNNGGGTFNGGTARTFSVDSASFAGFYSASMNNFTTTGFIKGNHITASGNISASGQLIAASADFKEGNITNVGNISVDTVKADTDGNVELGFGTGGISFNANTGDKITFNDSANNVDLEYSDENEDVIFKIDQSLAETSVTGRLKVTGHITASGNISASGNIITSGYISSSTDIFAKDIHLKQKSSPEIKLTDTSVGHFSKFVQANSITAIQLDGNSAQDFKIDSNADGNNLVVKGDSSWVGIGTGTPTAQLDVDGNLNVQSHITASGNISASSTSIVSTPTLQNVSNINFGTGTSGDIDLSSATFQLRSTNSGTNGLKLYGGVVGAAVPQIDTDTHTGIIHKVAGTTVADLRVGQFSVTGNITSSNNITAGNNISASGAYYGQVGNGLIISSSTTDTTVLTVNHPETGSIMEVNATGDSGSLALSGSLLLNNNSAIPANSGSRLYNKGGNLYFHETPIGPTQYEMLKGAMNDDIGTSEIVLPFNNNFENTIHSDEMGILCPCSGSLKTLSVRGELLSGDITYTLRAKTMKPGQTTSDTYTTIDTQTIDLVNANDNDPFTIVWDSDATVAPGDVLFFTIQGDVDRATAENYYFNAVIAWDYSTLPKSDTIYT